MPAKIPPAGGTCRFQRRARVPPCSRYKRFLPVVLRRVKRTGACVTPVARAPRPVQQNSVDGGRRTLPPPRPESFRTPLGAGGWLLEGHERAFVAVALPHQCVLLSLEEGCFAIRGERQNTRRFATQGKRRATASAWRLRQENKRSTRLLRRKAEAIPCPQRYLRRMLRKHIAHIEYDGCEASA